MPRVVAWIVTGVRVRSSVWDQFETHFLYGWAQGSEQSNILNRFSCEEFLISVYYIILKLTVFIRVAVQ